MQDYQRQFIEFARQQGALRFGDFTLKSGRHSPYFFNSGLFNDGASLYQLGLAYTSAIRSAGLEFNMLFGPAYKGIPLVAAVSMVWHLQYGERLPYCFDRKEVKDHGEGGKTTGAELRGRVLIIDDVISAGTSVNHSVDILQAAGAEPAGIGIALDRQERGEDKGSAVQEVEQRHGLRVISIITLEHLIESLGESPEEAGHLDRIREYQRKYGIL